MLVEAYVVYLLSKKIKLINLRYHHVLKTHCLGSKCNWHVDYIIQALVLDFLPEIQTQLSQQAVKLEGLNLEAACHKQILRITRNISLDSICQIGDTKFFITSESCPGHHYTIDLNQLNCNCYDFPRIWHCKHIAAINVHIPGLCPKVDCPSKILECMCIPILPKPIPRPEESTKILKDINTLCQQLNTVSDHSTPDLKALKSVKFSLTQVIALANGSQALPEKDVFHPNKNTWAETAKHMGAKPPKRKPGPIGGNTSTECIGPVKGRHACKYSDPYAVGKRSGKRAKPNVVSVAANEHSHTVVPTPPPFTHVDSPARASPSAAVAGTTAHSFTCVDQSMPGPLIHPPSSAAPGLAFSPLSIALCYDLPNFSHLPYPSLATPNVVSYNLKPVTKPPVIFPSAMPPELMGKTPLPLNPPSLSPLEDLPPKLEQTRPTTPQWTSPSQVVMMQLPSPAMSIYPSFDLLPIQPPIPIPWNTHHRQYSSMESYQEPPLVENPLEDQNSPIEDAPRLPLEPTQYLNTEDGTVTLSSKEPPLRVWTEYHDNPPPPVSRKHSLSPTSPSSAPIHQRTSREGSYQSITPSTSLPIEGILPQSQGYQSTSPGGSADNPLSTQSSADDADSDMALNWVTINTDYLKG